ncbi:MAG TPA: Do family serine endopeptidase [Opitutaceae bacterium]|jgi:Do/DeqQ family serine protease|nr:Do family serine endopeptidase [Opitutaceae bacterium]
MKSKPFSSIILMVLAAGAVGLLVAAKDVVAPAAKPVLHVDLSPVSDGKSGIVTSYADVVAPVQKAVVSVYSTKIVREHVPMDPFLRQFFGGEAPSRESKQEGLGSGVIVSSDGYILTNNHVVEGADELNVMLPDDREFKARVIGTDPKTDVAVIKIEADHLPTVTLADSDKLRVGDIVFAIGNPLAIGQTVTMGIVSATGRKTLGLLDNVGGYEDFIQTDAAINMGNSGGALIDAKGRLVGVNSAIISTSRGNIGIGFAIPINLASSIMQSLIETGKVARGYLGVTAEDVTSEVAEQLGVNKDTKGVVVTDVKPDSPAAKAGLKRSDVILAINDKVVKSLEDFRLLIAETLPGTKVNVQIVHDAKPQVIAVTLAALSDEVTQDEIIPGVTVIKLTDEKRRELNIDDNVTGLLITNIDDSSPYSDRLVNGVIILEINRTPVTDVQTAKSLIASGRNLFLVYYHGVYRFLSIDVK